MALTPQARETFIRLFGAEPQPHPIAPSSSTSSRTRSSRHGISLPLENASIVDATDPNAREQASAAIASWSDTTERLLGGLPLRGAECFDAPRRGDDAV